jgi:hypothetical protein
MISLSEFRATQIQHNHKKNATGGQKDRHFLASFTPNENTKKVFLS